MADSTQQPVEDDWVTVPAGAPPEQPKADEGDWAAAAAPKTPYRSDAPPAYAPQADPVTRFGEGVWRQTGQGLVPGLESAGKAVWDVLKSGGDENALSPETKQLWSNIVNAHVDQANKAKAALDQGDYKSAIGHFLASKVPLVGPAAAHAAERTADVQPTYDKYGNVVQSGTQPDLAGAIGEGVGLLLPSAAAHGASAAVQGVANLPRATRAAQALDEVNAAAHGLPVNLSGPLGAATRAEQLASAGANAPKVITDFLTRARNPQLPPMTWQEARDFYNNASRLSASESLAANRSMMRQLGEFKAQLHQALVDTAGQAGQGDKYAGAIREYAGAMRNRELAQKAKDAVMQKAIPSAIGGGGLAYLWKKFLTGKATGGTILDAPPRLRQATLDSLRR